jgi:hypothetical protein
MAKPSMPLIRVCRVAYEGLFNEFNVWRLEGIEPRLTFAFQEQVPCRLILNKKMPWMEFKEDIIITR